MKKNSIEKWKHSTEYTSFEVAALIVGKDPYKCGNIDVEPIKRRMKFAYEAAVNAHIRILNQQERSVLCESVPENALQSNEMLALNAKKDSYAHFYDWLQGDSWEEGQKYRSNYGEQTFSKEEIVRWLKASDIPSDFFMGKEVSNVADELKEAKTKIAELEEIICNKAETGISGYSTQWMAIQRAVIVEFFDPRQSVDAAKELVVDWIKKRAQAEGIESPTRIAEAMFTIIKPDGHNPRKRRGLNLSI